MTIEIPDWCIIGKTIEWNRPDLTGTKWVREEILSFGYDGFYHRACNCPVYYSEFSEYGKTVRECKEKRRKKI